ncbi:ribonuclease III [Westerdykella ornata]|uniref:Ribonuclease III n=1 Tax=Westerdykella ornata TaxID=318751 RepID=A0A6A6J8D4_WESOR|nr:ribonuclease III [Westerdykella ornata]KAF2272268.1 ribonuclease III [Westerdykella ornata]
MSEKRGRYDDHSGRHQNFKKHKPNSQHGNRDNRPRNPPSQQASQSVRIPDDIVRLQQEIASLPDPKNCTPCQKIEKEMDTGIIALLDHLVQEEAADPTRQDQSILHHARSLRDLLSTRASSLTTTRLQTLDSKRPETAPPIKIPPYTLHRLQQSKSLPPLPPISDPHIESLIFTHRSFADARLLAPRGYRGTETNYESLEFLGDAYIEAMASRLLYSRFPDIEPSLLSSFREKLVKNETLAGFSNAYGLPDRLKHGAHIKETKAWGKIVADVFEAYVAGIILSSPDSAEGFSAAEEFLTALWTPQMLAFQPPVMENPRARDEINKLLAAKGIKLEYREERGMRMEDGKQKFFIGLYLTGWGFEDEWLGSGEGRNKGEACVRAAMDALKDGRGVIKVANKRKLEVYPSKEKSERKKGKDGNENVGVA